MSIVSSSAHRVHSELPSDFRPTPAEQAWALGHQLGREGIPAAAPPDQPAEVREAFARGYATGRDVFEDEAFEVWVDEQERQAEAFGDPWDHVNPAEVIEARGCLVARREGEVNL